jgi:hypothetical protein
MTIGSSLKPTMSKQECSERNEALTVCIPIQKEVKLQVKCNCVERKEVEGDTDAVKCMAQANGLKKDEAEVESNSKEKPSADIKSPTLTLVKVQDLMFDPKYMFKEYNLRRVRKQELSPEQSSSHKKQKQDKAFPAARGKAEKCTREAEEDSPPSASEKAKRKRPNNTKEQSNYLPHPKKLRDDTTHDAESSEDTAHKKTQGGNLKQCKRVLDFSVSISRAKSNVSSPPQVTLTQLLSMPHNAKQSPSSINIGAGDELNGRAAAKVPSTVSRLFGSRSLGGSQLICCLCKLKGGVSSLGFLFGPYFYHHESGSSRDKVKTSSSGNVEVWLHEDCAVWAPGMCLVGRELQGLQETLSDANKMICTVCKKTGATLCCASRGCNNIYHYPCAIEKGCVLTEDQFQTHCPKHRDNNNTIV